MTIVIKKNWSMRKRKFANNWGKKMMLFDSLVGSMMMGQKCGVGQSTIAWKEWLYDI